MMPREYGFFPLGRSSFNCCRRGVRVGFNSLGGSGMQQLYIFLLFLRLSCNWTRRVCQCLFKE